MPRVSNTHATRLADQGEAARTPRTKDHDPSSDVRLHLPAPTRPVHAELLAALPSIAATISSPDSIEDVLDAVVAEAKRLLGDGKVVVGLIDAPSSSLDPSHTVVRGCRRQHPESWWRDRVDGLARITSRDGMPQLVRYQPAWILCVPIAVEGHPVGLISAISTPSQPFSEDLTMQLALLGAFAGPAIEKARSSWTSRQMLLMDERNRISKEMHDGLAQSLFTVSLGLEVCKKRVEEHPDELLGRLDEVQTLVRESLTELRRCIHDLRPLSLERLGLEGSIRRRLSEIEDGQDISISFDTDGSRCELEPAVEACVYRVAQEAISNAARHSGAAHISVRLTYGRDEVSVLVRDDGHGFDVDRARESAETGRSLGLESLRERAEAEGGSVAIASIPNGGTTVRVKVRCRPKHRPSA